MFNEGYGNSKLPELSELSSVLDYNFQNFRYYDRPEQVSGQAPCRLNALASGVAICLNTKCECIRCGSDSTFNTEFLKPHLLFFLITSQFSQNPNNFAPLHICCHFQEVHQMILKNKWNKNILTSIYLPTGKKKTLKDLICNTGAQCSISNFERTQPEANIIKEFNAVFEQESIFLISENNILSSVFNLEVHNYFETDSFFSFCFQQVCLLKQYKCVQICMVSVMLIGFSHPREKWLCYNKNLWNLETLALLL